MSHHPVRCLPICLLALLGLLGCKPSLIPDTQISDTPENREILAMVERYRQAMEKRDIASLKALVSDRYYENASSTGDQSDDWGFPDLDRVVEEVGGAVKTCTYDIRVTDIRVEGDRAEVVYEFTWNFQYSDGEQDGWSRKTDVNRISLLKDDGVWRFVAGM